VCGGCAAENNFFSAFGTCPHLTKKIILMCVGRVAVLSAAMHYNVLRLMAVGLLEHSTFLTDKRLFKDTKGF
jgi:hypothetical protein